jgi:hypothetical protein
MQTIMEILIQAMGKAVREAFKKLLSEKHLYQSVQVDMAGVSEAGEILLHDWNESYYNPGNRTLGQQTPDGKLKNEIAKVTNGLWMPHGVTRNPDVYFEGSIFVGFELPTINTFCDNCQASWPCNPASQGSSLVEGIGQDEFFYLGYVCQQCKGEPIRFLLRREGLKLRLAGRYPLEVLPTPKALPKSASKYYSDALIAYHAGQTLAGLFFLRVFIEQFWKTVPAIQELIKQKPRASGDEQAEAYFNTLPPSIQLNFPSLKEVYGKLSVAIHTASEDEGLFEEACLKIIKHFKARELYELT